MAPERYEGDTRDDSPQPSESPRTSRRTLPLPITLAFVALALIGGYLLGRPGYPLDNSADAGFLRDMSVHHAQAVDMALLVHERSDDPGIVRLAHDMTRTQQEQIGRMQGWLVQWGLPARSSRPAMEWMAGHDHGGSADGADAEGTGAMVGEDGLMPGMATDEELAELREAEGVEAEIVFLELMIPHHISGVEMAEAAVELAEESYVVELARGMAEAQESEIELLEELLAERED